MSVRVYQLIDMLKELPPEMVVWTAGSEGVYPMELGNLMPFKVYLNKPGSGLYIDDGMCSYAQVVDNWMSLNEYVDAKKFERQ